LKIVLFFIRSLEKPKQKIDCFLIKEEELILHRYHTLMYMELVVNKIKKGLFISKKKIHWACCKIELHL